MDKRGYRMFSPIDVVERTSREIPMEILSSSRMKQWDMCDIDLRASQTHPWWTFPVTATFTHTQTGHRIVLQGFWTGPKSWTVRFAAPVAGDWSYEISSDDPGLARAGGRRTVELPSAEEVALNPNYRGHVGISQTGRHFAYADGTPFFLL